MLQAISSKQKPSFVEGTIAALLLAIAGSFFYSALTLFFNPSLSLALVINVLALAYTLYLLWRSPRAHGKIAISAIYLALLISILFLQPPLWLHIVFATVSLSVIRSLFYYSSLVPASIDLILSLLNFTILIWAYHQTQSLFITLWSYFLVQALFSFIPTKNLDKKRRDHEDNHFNRAHQQAEAAFNKIIGGP